MLEINKVPEEDEKFNDFCFGLEVREKEGVLPHYAVQMRGFLWNEIAYKADDIREAVKKWVMTGEKTELSVQGLTIPDDFWTSPLVPSVSSQGGESKAKDTNDKKKTSSKGMVVTTTMLESARNMNYIAAAFTIDWLRREPRKALTVLHRGVI